MAMLKTGTKSPVLKIDLFFSYTCQNEECGYVKNLEKRSKKTEVCPKCGCDMKLGSIHAEDDK